MRSIPATLCFSALLVLGATSPSLAQNKDSKASELQRLARESYDLGDYGEARAKLQEALARLDKAGKSHTEQAAGARVLLGVVLAAGLHDSDAAFEQFIQALKIDPKASINPDLSTDELEALLERAHQKLSPTCGSFAGLHHVRVSEAPVGEPLTVKCMVGTAIPKAKVEIRYKPEGASDYQAVPMKPTGECGRVGTIPAEAMTGAQLRYYVAALTDAGKVAAADGNPASPIVVELRRAGASAGPGGGGAGGEEGAQSQEEVPDQLRAAKTKKGGSCAGCDSSGPGSAGGLLLAGLVLLLVRRRSASC